MRAVGWVALGVLACAPQADTLSVDERADDRSDVGGADGEDSGLAPAAVRTEEQRVEVRSGRDGIAWVDVEVGPDHTALHVTARADGAYLAVDAVVDPDGERVVDGDAWRSSREQLTTAFYPELESSFVNWPVRRGDGKLRPGTWSVGVFALGGGGSAAADVAVDAVARLKADDDFKVGRIEVDLFYAGGGFDDEVLRRKIDRAVTRWRDIWGAVGVELDVASYPTDLRARPGVPGQDDYRRVVRSGRDEAVSLVLAEGIAGAGALGIAGGIPGSLEPTDRSVTVVSWLDHAGPDGELDASEIAILAETMAHETGHFVGLPHVVETNYALFDALDDTPECGSERSCIRDVGDNNMFPFPLCGGGGCIEQIVVTSDQASVIHRFIGTR